MRQSWLIVSWFGLAFLGALACSSNDDPTPPPGAGSDASDQEAAVQDSSPQDQHADSADGGQEAQDAASEEPPCVPVEFTPTPADIQFKAINKMPSGEQLLVGKWSSTYGKPDVVTSMQPDGTGEVTLFEVFRVWSMGVSRAVDRIAFSTAEPEQAQHTCINIGDAIQHTWVYDIETETVELLAGGLINDECHLFGPGDKFLYVCRRYDWKFDGKNVQSKGYTVGRIGLADNSFEFLTQEQGYDMSLHGVPSEDEASLYFTRIHFEGSSQARAIMRKPMGGPDAGAEQEVRAQASAMTMSPDGTKYVFSDTADKSALYVSNLDGTGVVKIADANGTDPAFSPDGTRLAYMVWDNAAICSHIEVVSTDGSEASTPTRIHDCAKAGDSPAELAWVVRP